MHRLTTTLFIRFEMQLMGNWSSDGQCHSIPPH